MTPNQMMSRASRGAPAAGMGGQGTYRDFFAYSITFTALAAAASATGQIQIQADSDFELQKITQFTDVGGGDQTTNTRIIPLVTVQVVDTGSGRQVFAFPVPIGAIAGDGTLPFILPTTKIFDARSSLSIVVANFSAATSYNLRLIFIGTKLFRYGNQAPT